MTRVLITSALPYINGIKHLGTLVGSMLPADVLARFSRARGHETLFICATDEHGTPAELAAAAAGQDVRTYCDDAWLAEQGLELDAYLEVLDRAIREGVSEVRHSNFNHCAPGLKSMGTSSLNS